MRLIRGVLCFILVRGRYKWSVALRSRLFRSTLMYVYVFDCAFSTNQHQKIMLLTIVLYFVFCFFAHVLGGFFYSRLY